MAAQRSGIRLVDVTYDLVDPDGDVMTVRLYLSPDGGQTFPVSCASVTGDVGSGVTSGRGRRIVWDAGADYPGHVGNDYVVKVTADDGKTPSGMVWIPPGWVLMGQSGIAGPEYEVYLAGFYIDVREVSNGEYKKFIDAGGYQNAAWWNPVQWRRMVAENITLPTSWRESRHGGGKPGAEAFPVSDVSWWEADAYCRWAGKRLPTEAEWEKAAKGGCEKWGDPAKCDSSDTPTYPWGEEISPRRANYSSSDHPYYIAHGAKTPVGYYNGSNHGGYQTIDSPSPYGLYDVAGNVSEWCSTSYEWYPYDPNDGREDPPSTHITRPRVLRGGSCYSTWDSKLRCASRSHAQPYETWSAGLGCARSR